MSQRRVVNVGDLDLTLLKESAESRSHKVEENAKVNLYYSEDDRDCDLVIDGEIGFRRKVDGTVESIYDDMRTDKYADIMAGYIEESTESHGLGQYHVVGRADTNDKTVVVIERR